MGELFIVTPSLRSAVSPTHPAQKRSESRGLLRETKNGILRFEGLSFIVGLKNPIQREFRANWSWEDLCTERKALPRGVRGPQLLQLIVLALLQ